MSALHYEARFGGWVFNKPYCSASISGRSLFRFFEMYFVLIPALAMIAVAMMVWVKTVKNRPATWG